jgi:hypothetical protein
MCIKQKIENKRRAIGLIMILEHKHLPNTHLSFLEKYGQLLRNLISRLVFFNCKVVTLKYCVILPSIPGSPKIYLILYLL